MNKQRLLSLDDFQRAARRHLPGPVYHYIAGAVEDDLSVRDNRHAFDELGFLPRMLVDTSKRSLKTPLFGVEYDAPFGIAPMGISALSAYRGDLMQAKAAAAANIPMIMSGSSLIRMEDVCTACPGTWFQAYVPGDTKRIPPLIDRIAAAGFRTLVVTVDVAVLSNREQNVRAGFSTPLRPSLRLAWDGITHPRWLFGSFLRTFFQHGMPHFENNFAERGAPILSRNVARDFGARDHLDWSDLDLIRKRWQGRLVLKGIMHPADAVLAREHGVDGIIVSNHGGRQLDGAASPMRVLPSIVDVAGGMTIMIDSGFRRGTDILKAFALGAQFVFVGRPMNFAAAVGGQEGVAHAISLLKQEVDRDLALQGIQSPRDMRPEHLIRLSGLRAPGMPV